MQPKQEFCIEVREATCGTCPMRAIPESTWESLVRPEVESPYFAVNRLLSIGDELSVMAEPDLDPDEPYYLDGDLVSMPLVAHIASALNTINREVIRLHESEKKGSHFAVTESGELHADSIDVQMVPESEFTDTTRAVLACLRKQMEVCSDEVKEKKPSWDAFLNMETYCTALDSIADIAPENIVTEYLERAYMGLVDARLMFPVELGSPEHQIANMTVEEKRARLAFLATYLRQSLPEEG